ncbi:hypothetical protein BDR26DRAFT_866275 [Obelidium mucronatum]|nr:hypothetical protein BDR26DRAFT_866275 [Obelidium mucronatum]
MLEKFQTTSTMLFLLLLLLTPMPPRLPRRLLLVPQDNRLLMRLDPTLPGSAAGKLSLEELSSLKFHFHSWDLMIQLVWEHQPSKLVLLRIPQFLLILLQVLQRLILLQLLLVLLRLLLVLARLLLVPHLFPPRL